MTALLEAFLANAELELGTSMCRFQYMCYIFTKL